MFHYIQLERVKFWRSFGSDLHTYHCWKLLCHRTKICFDILHWFVVYTHVLCSDIGSRLVTSQQKRHFIPSLHVVWFCVLYARAVEILKFQDFCTEINKSRISKCSVVLWSKQGEPEHYEKIIHIWNALRI